MVEHQNLRDRLGRSLSWLEAASNLRQDQSQVQVEFIFLFIAFNCLYGKRQYEGAETKIRQDLEEYFTKILDLHEINKREGGTTLSEALKRSRYCWLQLLEDEYLDNGYWRTAEHRQGFKEKYRSQKFSALARLKNREYKELLHVIFSRIVVLRNQIMHGSATYGPKSKGWESIQKATPVLRALVPALRELMCRSGDAVDWPKIPYPRRGSAQHPRRPLGA